MKKSLLFTFVVLFCLPVFSQTVKRSDIKKHCNAFVKALEKSELKESLKFFNVEFVKNHHDIELKGNTVQFIEEYLAGYDEEASETMTLIKPALDDILEIELDEIDFYDDNSCYVTFDIDLKSGKELSTIVKIVWTSASDLGFIVDDK